MQGGTFLGDVYPGSVDLKDWQIETIVRNRLGQRVRGSSTGLPWGVWR